MLAGVSFRNVGPGFGQQAAEGLEAAITAGAVGLGEIPKSFGLSVRKADGTRLRIDDPELDPIWEERTLAGARPVFPPALSARAVPTV